MINIVVGDNATGKTNVVTQNYLVNQDTAVSNFSNDTKSKVISLNRNKLDYVISELDLSSVKVVIQKYYMLKWKII